MTRTLDLAAACALLCGAGAQMPAGDLTPPGAPQATMVTLEEIGASAGEGRTTILPDAAASPGLLINQPGSYVLIADVTMQGADAICIEISADDVQIDLNGHALAGQGSGSSWGIRQTAGSRATVFNGTIREFGVEGIELGAVARVHDLNVSSNGRGGIDVEDSSIVERVIADANGTLLGPDAAICAGATSRVSGCVVSDTTGPGKGICVASGSEVTDCHVSVHSGGGVAIEAGQTSAVRGCTVNTVSGAAFSLVEGCSISRCTAWGGQSNGIEAGDSCLVSDNVMRLFQGRAISLQGDRSRVTGNLCENSAAGIIVDASSFNQIADNTVINDGNEVGLGSVGDSTRNLWVRNMLSGVVIDAAAGDTVGPLVIGTNVLTSDLPWANLEH